MRKKWIDGFEGRYEIYEDGRVYSHLTNRFLNIQVDRNGYSRINLLDGMTKKVVYRSIHRLLALAFIPNDYPDVRTSVDHKDNDQSNNALSNLRWCTHKENIKYYHEEQRTEPILDYTRSKRLSMYSPMSAKTAATRLNTMTPSKPKVSQEEITAMLRERYGKKVLVNGLVYSSAREAAKYIHTTCSRTVSSDTIRKEIQKLVQGKRQAWTMYGEYRIELPAP